MRIMTIVLVIAAAIWGGWWVLASRSAQTAAERWFEDRARRGMIAQHQGISVQGFPNRIDLTVADPVLADPRLGLGWQAPFLQIFALSYRPWHLIAIFPESQRIATPAGLAGLLMDRGRASVVLRPGLDPQLDRATLSSEGPSLVMDAGGTLRAQSARAALHHRADQDEPDTTTVYQLGLAIEGLRADAEAMSLMGVAEAGLPLHIDTIRLDARLHLDAPLSAAPSRPPALRRLQIDEARVAWGTLSFGITGTLEPDAAGRAEGTMQLTLQNWPAALALAQGAGVLRREQLRTLTALLDGLAPPGRDGGRQIDLPVRLSGGLIRLGPLVLGPAPRF